jgi:mono/diheme cytochrome c family protein
MSSPSSVEEERSMSRVLSLLAGAPLACGALLPAVAQDAPKGDVANGKKVYLATGCYMCHGRAGQGGAYNGPAPVLAKTEMPYEGFKGQLRQPTQDMPAYSEPVMSDQQIADIYAFLQSLPGRRDPKSIAILNY